MLGVHSRSCQRRGEIRAGSVSDGFRHSVANASGSEKPQTVFAIPSLTLPAQKNRRNGNAPRCSFPLAITPRPHHTGLAPISHVRSEEHTSELQSRFGISY